MRTHQDENQEPVVRLLQTLRPVPPRNPEAAAKGRTGFARACQRAALERESAHQRRPQLRVAAMLVGLVLVLISSTGLAVSASQTALPGDSLYPVKLAAEQVAIALSFGPAARSQKLVDRAYRRAQELDLMAFGGTDRIQDEDLARFERHLAAARQQAHALPPEQARLTEALLQRLQAAEALHRGVMYRLQETTPAGRPEHAGPARDPDPQPPLDPTAPEGQEAEAPGHNRYGPSEAESQEETPSDPPQPPATGADGPPITNTPTAQEPAAGPTGGPPPTGNPSPTRPSASSGPGAESEPPRPGATGAASGSGNQPPGGP